MIQLEAVTKLYGTVIGVNEISLTLEPGNYGLLGPNGSGKTTLINLLMGQLRPTIGSVRVFGIDPSRRDRVLRRVGLCPASDLLIPNVSALDWVSY
ncbi:MAG: ATP-binding cassette domain-containing protein, partial [Planctomycetota bacterium]|nr:ATP-binding cassette domain-containing protein [Planctomycetota bacterium]